MHMLTVTSLYPNSEQVRNGVFVRERLHKLLASAPGWRITVIAPVPWFPFKSPRFGRYGTFARIPQCERDGAVEVLHPRYLQIPRFGSWLAPLAYYWSVRRCLKSKRIARPDFIDAHFAFPDGAAAVLLARAMRRPLSLTVRGSDLNIIANEVIAGRWVRWALRHADLIISVSAALAARAKELMPPNERWHGEGLRVIRNGVDFARFQRQDDVAAAKRRLELNGHTVLSVGNLIPLKGHDITLHAVAQLPGCTLCVIGSGPQQTDLEELAHSLGISDRVRFLGEMRQDELIEYYNAADVTVLASSHEGLPNVVLESLACGTPVVATCVGGIPEVMTRPEMGVLLAERTPEAVRGGIQQLSLKRREDAERARAAVRSFDWSCTVAELQQAYRWLVKNAPNAANDNTRGEVA